MVVVENKEEDGKSSLFVSDNDIYYRESSDFIGSAASPLISHDSI